MVSFPSLRAIVLALSTAFSSPAVAQETLDDVVKKQPDFALGVGLYGHRFDTRRIVAGILREYEREDYDVSDLARKGNPIPLLEVGLELSVPFAEVMILTYGVSISAGVFLGVTSTTFPGVELDQDGKTTFRKSVKTSRKDYVQIPIPANYDLSGELSSVVVMGKLGGTHWYGHQKIRLGSRAELALGGMLLWGDAAFSARLQNTPLRLAEGNFSTLSGGLSAMGVVNPLLLQVYSVECGVGIGERYNKIWFSVEGNMGGPGVVRNDFQADFSPSFSTGTLTITCLYQVGK